MGKNTHRTIDSDGYTLDFQLRKTRNHQAAYAFMGSVAKFFSAGYNLEKDVRRIANGIF
ncbi:hypothetical protein [Bacillus thuringiensis]|uniref:hypothetical protein n=1 Tax=Bacillus thuringiensis TaxID=1428 RepID=UPI003F64F769